MLSLRLIAALKKHYIEGIIVVFLFCFSITMSSRQLDSWGGTPRYYQYTLAPAVMLASGRGFLQPVPDNAAIDDFLSLKTESFDPTLLPEKLDARPVYDSVFEGRERYRAYFLAAIWWVHGISWAVLTPYFCTLFALSSLLAYFVFRLGIGRLISAALAISLILSQSHLEAFPHFRDFSKEPFFFAVLLLIGILVTRRPASKRLFWLSSLAGLILGIGIGFRRDILILVIPFFLALFLFTPGHILSHYKRKAFAGLLFLAAFVLASYPILISFSQGSNSYKVILDGLAPHFDEALGVTPSLYEFGPLYSDAYEEMSINSYALVQAGEARPLYPFGDQEIPKFFYNSPSLDKASKALFFDITRHFPADLLIRAYAALLHVVQLPFKELGMPAYLAGDTWLGAIYKIRTSVLGLFSGWGGWFLFAAIISISSRHPRTALFMAICTVYFSAYPALVFQKRHLFHLEFLSLWGLGFLIHQLLKAAMGFYLTPTARKRTIHLWKSRILTWGSCLRVSLFVLFILTTALLPLFFFRAYQQQHLTELIQYIAATSRSVVHTNTIPLTQTINLIEVKGLFTGEYLGRPWAKTPYSETQYIVITFSGDGLQQTSEIEGQLSYAPSAPRNDYSRPFTVKLMPGKDTFIFAPVYYDYENESYFRGIKIAPESGVLIKSIERLHTLQKIPYLLHFQCPPDWHDYRLYQTL